MGRCSHQLADGPLVGRGLFTYGTVKAAVSHVTRSLAAGLARRSASRPGSASSRDTLQRLATVDEVANNGVWLAFRASSYMTGKIIELDGGAETLLDCRRNDRRCALLV